MSLLNQLFNRGVFGSKCKTCLTLALSRIKLLQNKRELQLRHMRKEIAQFLQAGQESIARIRVEHVIREQNIWAAFEILELFCEFVLARIPILDTQKECPAEVREAVASIIFASPRCSEVPDLLHVKNLFTAKYGKEFVTAASELRPDSGVNRAIIEKLSVGAAPEERLKVLKEIAKEYNLEWDWSETEVELNKRHEDLLAGSKQAVVEGSQSQAPSIQSTPSPRSNINGASVDSRQEEQNVRLQASSPSSASNKPLANTDEIGSRNMEPVSAGRKNRNEQSSDILELARAAIAKAERATSAARAAAALVSVNLSSQKLQ
ncbi:IST1 homolog [Linum perenne]